MRAVNMIHWRQITKKGNHYKCHANFQIYHRAQVPRIEKYNGYIGFFFFNDSYELSKALDLTRK